MGSVTLVSVELQACFLNFSDLIHTLDFKINRLCIAICTMYSCNLSAGIREGFKKKNTTNLGFWLKLGGGGVRGGSRAPTC